MRRSPHGPRSATSSALPNLGPLAAVVALGRDGPVPSWCVVVVLLVLVTTTVAASAATATVTQIVRLRAGAVDPLRVLEIENRRPTPNGPATVSGRHDAGQPNPCVH